MRPQYAAQARVVTIIAVDTQLAAIPILIPSSFKYVLLDLVGKLEGFGCTELERAETFWVAIKELNIVPEKALVKLVATLNPR